MSDVLINHVIYYVIYNLFPVFLNFIITNSNPAGSFLYISSYIFISSYSLFKTFILIFYFEI
jgi:hypothetical protein